MNYVKIQSITIISLLILGSCGSPVKDNPAIEKGILDLSSWNFEEDGIVTLNGQWEFYWEQLLEPQDFKLEHSLHPDLINVPCGWAKQKGPEVKSYPQFGYATYRLRIVVPEKDTDYNFIFMSIFANAKVWVNGSLCFENGKVGTTKELSEPAFTTAFHTPIKYGNFNDTLEIIIQVSDFSYGGPAAGLRRKVVFGPGNQISDEHNKAGSIHALLIGILLMIAVYHFFLFGYRTNEHSYLLFAVLSLIVAVWTTYTAGFFIDLLSYEGYLVLGHIGPAIFPPLLVLFYYFIYRNEVHKTVMYLFLTVAAVFMTIVLVSSATTMSNIFTAFSINMVIPFSYLVVYTVPKALIKKRQGAVLTYLGVLIMFGSVIHDALLSNSLVTGFGNYISSYGFVALIIMQSLVLAQMFSITFQRNINLNVNLEKLVKERTRIIDEQKRILENQNLDLLRQKQEIQTQNEILNQRNEEIEIQRDYAHRQNEEIRDSINYAERIQSAMLPPATYVSELLNENFILYKPRDIVSGDFYWIKQVNRFVVLVAADCTGHGVPGAFMSILGISYLTEIVQRREITQANQILNELRKQIMTALRQHGGKDEAKDGIDMALCVLDLKNKTMQYCGANNPLYLIRGVDKEPRLQEFKADPMQLGYYQGKYKKFTNHDIKLEHGDSIYIFSDGYIDQKGGKDDKRFMSRRFKALLQEIRDQPMIDQKEILEKRHSDWMGNNSQTDDILVIGVRV